MNAIHHIAFSCIDRLAQERFYTKQFGFRRTRVFNPDTPAEFIMLSLGDTRIELFSADGNTDGVRGHEQHVGFKHLAFSVPDIEASVAALHADGIETDDIIDCSGLVEGLKVCFFDDPEGNRLELMEGYKDQF